MTVQNNNPVSGPILSDGVMTLFPFGFKIVSATHIRLSITDLDGSNKQDVSVGLTVAPQYLNQDNGGYVGYTPGGMPLPTGKRVFVYRDVPNSQPNRIGNQGGFFPETHEQTFDLLEMQIQQLAEALSRTITFPYGTNGQDIPVAENGTVLGWVDGILSNIDPVAFINTAGLVPATRTVTGSGGLMGGGNLSADRVISLSLASIASLALADSAIQPIDLGSAAFTSATAYATAAQGVLAANALPRAGGTMTGPIVGDDGGVHRSSKWFMNDVRDSGAATGGTAAANLIAFNTAAGLAAPEVFVSAGTYTVNEAIALGTKNWTLAKGAKITDAGGSFHDASYLGAAAGEFLTPHPIDNYGRIRSDHGMLHVLKEVMSTAQAGGLSYNHSNQVYRYVDSSVGVAGGDTAYYVTGAGYWVYSPVGVIAKAEGRRQSGSTDLFGGLLFMSTNTGDDTKPGRSEMTPVSIGAYCAHDWVGAANGQQKINIYNDWNMSGPSNEEERFMSVHNVFVRKFHSGDTYDADHNGSFGISIGTAPGNDGFGVPATSGIRTHPLRAGLAISGYSGLQSEGATNGDAAAAGLGYKYGVLVGGSNNVYLDGSTSGMSKIGIAYAGRDYTTAGLQLFSAHPSASDPYAIDASSNSGRFKFGVDSLGAEFAGIGNTSDQYATNLRLAPTSHATSRRTGLAFNNRFTLITDLAANDTDDFGIYHAATGRFPFAIDANDKITLWSLVIGQAYTPGGTSDTAGVQREILVDDSYIYWKTSTGWKRSAGSTW